MEGVSDDAQGHNIGAPGHRRGPVPVVIHGVGALRVGHVHCQQERHQEQDEQGQEGPHLLQGQEILISIVGLGKQGDQVGAHGHADEEHVHGDEIAEDHPMLDPGYPLNRFVHSYLRDK